MRKFVPLLLVSLLLSGFRAFPSLSEPDPRVVFDQFQDTLDRAGSLDDLYKYMSRRKVREYQRKAETPGGDDVLGNLQKNFHLMQGKLVAQELHSDSAMLVYQGAVNLNGLDYVTVTMGVLMVKEAGGFLSEIGGKPHRLDSPNILAANGHLGGPLSRLLRGIAKAG